MESRSKSVTTPFHRSYEKSNWSYEKGKILAGAFEIINRSYEKLRISTGAYEKTNRQLRKRTGAYE